LLPTDPAKRRSTLQQISKIRKVVEFVQGSKTSDADVKKDISFAWSRCKESLSSILGHWPFHGSVRYAYDQRNELRKSLGLEFFDSCKQRLVCVQRPILRQPEMTNYFDKKGQILVIDEDAGIEDADTDVPFSDAVPPAECLECPICPTADLVVYRNSDSLWQHWKTRHANDVRPALFKIHRVLGMKLVSKRNASWNRVPDAMSYHHSDYPMLKMREDIVTGYIKLTPGMLIEIEPGSDSKANGERWFAAVRDGRVMEGDRILAQFCHTNCLELANEEPQKLTIANILGLGPFKNVPLRQLQASASQKDMTSPAKRSAPKQTPLIGKHVEKESTACEYSTHDTTYKPGPTRIHSFSPRRLESSYGKFAATQPTTSPASPAKWEAPKQTPSSGKKVAATQPATTAEHTTTWKQRLDSDRKFTLGINIMLRSVSHKHTWYQIPKVVVAHWDLSVVTIGTTAKNDGFPVFKYKGASFIDNDYGMQFAYPSWIQSVLHSFDMNETYRCFYLALGIATSIDPFMLQCLFRMHSKLVARNADNILEFLRDEDHAGAHIAMELEEVTKVLQPNEYFDSSLLRFFWPEEFNNFRIVIISTRGKNHYETVFHSANMSSSAKTVYLKFQSDHYTHLTLITGDLTHETSSWLLHEVCPEIQCPSIKSLVFKSEDHDDAYIAGVIAGNLPSEEQVSALWLRVTQKAGLSADAATSKWVNGLPPGTSTSDHLQHGSLVASSWNDVRESLIQQHFKPTSSRVSRASTRNYTSPVRLPSDAVMHMQRDVPLVFLDVGSEAGTGLLKMLHDSRITHAAGIELQHPWYALSVQLFKDLRTEFVQHGYRMPEISLFSSCMMSSKPALQYVYASASIVWMNNFVFDKAPYFNNKKKRGGSLEDERDASNAPLAFLKMSDPARTSLSANAAYTFSTRFTHSTCVAVFCGNYFAEVFDYKTVKELPVSATWGVWQKIGVTIVTHHQHGSIASGIRFRCVSHQDACLWNHCMKLWGCSLARAYELLKQLKWHKNQSRPVSGTGKMQRSGSVHLASSSDDESCVEFDKVDHERVTELEAELSKFPSGCDSKVSLQALSTLQPTYLVRSDIMIEYMRLIQKHYVNITTHSNTCLRFKELMSLRISDQMSRFALLHMPLETCPIILCLNSGIHWQAFKVDPIAKYIASMCSLNDPLKKSALQILTVLSSIVPEAKSYRHFSVSVPNQNNGTDCGPLCCMFMLFLAENDVTAATKLEYETKSTAQQFRLRIFADIANGKLTPLVHKE
jgi:Ulp1 protease family, C-terminal catalytic domain